MVEAGLLGGRRHRRGFRPAESPTCRWRQEAYSITDAESLSTARDLLRKEGILAGSSSGTLLAAALRYCREQTRPKRVVTFVCDSGNKYLSKMFNDFWMVDQGLLSARSIRRPARPDRAPSRRAAARSSSGPTTRCSPPTAACARADVSQLPVLDDGKLVGIIDESDLLLAVRRHDERRERFNAAGAASP